MMIPPDVCFDKPDDYRYHGQWPSPERTGMQNQMSRYALSKLANILFCEELQRRLDAKQVPIISLTTNPGGVNTEGDMSVWPVWMRPVMSRTFVAPSKGTVPILYLATAPEIKQNPTKYKALYYERSCKSAAPSTLTQHVEVARNLWQTSEEAVKGYIIS